MSKNLLSNWKKGEITIKQSSGIEIGTGRDKKIFFVDENGNC